MKKQDKLLAYKEYFEKYRGKKSAQEILFSWFNYCRKHNINPRGD